MALRVVCCCPILLFPAATSCHNSTTPQLADVLHLHNISAAASAAAVLASGKIVVGGTMLCTP